MAGLIHAATAIGTILLLASTAAGVDCTTSFTLEDGTYSYDLTPLKSRLTYVFRAKIGSYHYRYHGTQYDYLVNICDNVHVDRLHPACLKQESSPAYQVTAPPAKVFSQTQPTYSSKYTPPPPPPVDVACFRLADSISGNMMNWTLLNQSNPEDGVRLTYTGGQSCRKRNTEEVIKQTNETWYNAPRKFEIELECDRELGSDSRSFLTDLINSGATIQVEERSPPDECHYVMRWRTQYGCPIQGITFTSTFHTLFRWAMIAIVCVVAFVVITNVASLKKRYRQYSCGEFNGFADLVSHVASDVLGGSGVRRSRLGKDTSHML